MLARRKKAKIQDSRIEKVFDLHYAFSQITIQNLDKNTKPKKEM